MAHINAFSASWEITWTDNLSWIIIRRIYSCRDLRRLKGMLAFWDSWVVRYRILWSKNLLNLEILVRIFTYTFNNLFNNNSSLSPKLQWKKSTACKYCNFIFSLINRCIFVWSNMFQHVAPDSNASVWQAVWVCGSGVVWGWRLWKT